MDTVAPSKYRPENTSPLRNDAPGTVTEMPSPKKIHHVHIFSDVNYDAQVQFYKRLFNLDVVTERNEGFTFMTFDEHDHRVVLIKRPGWGTKPKQAIGFSHAAFCYASLGELIHVYKKMKGWGYTDNIHCTNHGNSTSFYYMDIDGNRVETMMDNFTPLETQDYKRYFQFTEEFGETKEADFDPEKMVALYESGTPDSLLINREEVRKLVREGKL